MCKVSVGGVWGGFAAPNPTNTDFALVLLKDMWLLQRTYPTEMPSHPRHAEHGRDHAPLLVAPDSIGRNQTEHSGDKSEHDDKKRAHRRHLGFVRVREESG